MAKTKANPIGAVLLDARRQRGLTQDQVAAAARERGLRWSRTTVTSIEIGRRALTIDEFIVLRGRALEAPELDAFFTRATALPATAGKAGPREAEVSAAKKLGVTPARLLAASRRLWGRTLSEERDRLVQAREPMQRLAEGYWKGQGRDVETESRRALRGHVTRELVEQLAKALRRA